MSYCKSYCKLLHQIPDPEGGCELIEGTVEIPTKVVSHSVRVRDHHHFWLATTPPSWKEIELEPLVIRFKFRGSHVSISRAGGEAGSTTRVVSNLSRELRLPRERVEEEGQGSLALRLSCQTICSTRPSTSRRRRRRRVSFRFEEKWSERNRAVDVIGGTLRSAWPREPEAIGAEKVAH